jgi:hypothetical protein
MEDKFVGEMQRLSHVINDSSWMVERAGKNPKSGAALFWALSRCYLVSARLSDANSGQITASSNLTRAEAAARHSLILAMDFLPALLVLGTASLYFLVTSVY